MGKPPTLILYHPIMGQEGYPVLAGRVQPAFDYLKETGTLKSEKVRVEEAQPIADELLHQVHSKSHIAQVGRTSFDRASRISAGAAVRAGEAVWQGEARNAFAFTGCAGHHASRDSAWGFCYYNNSALLIRHLRNTHGVKRFFIVDTDPHFGDGTRNILGDDPDVCHLNFYASFGEGEVSESDRKVDVSFPSACGDISFVEALERLALPLARRSQADMLLWNMGHDAHREDYGGFNLSLRAFPEMAKMLGKIADEVCQGRWVVLLSGGAEVLVARHAISSIIRNLAELSPLPQDTEEEPSLESAETKQSAQEIVEKIIKSLGL